MVSRPERVFGHTGTETLPRLLREAAVENLPLMCESMRERRRVDDEGLRVVKSCHLGLIPQSEYLLRLKSRERKHRLNSCQQPR